MKHEKSIERWAGGRATHDGAGVKLRRVLGGEWHQRLDPWLMLDEFGSDQPQDYIAGFPAHPHRGFETITYMLEGRMAHRDNRGNAGIVEAGGVQWMRAGKGIVHEEMPAQEAGMLRGFQFWLNLPASKKMSEPAWQDVKPADIPVWQNESVSIKVLAGNYAELQGPIQREDTQPMILDIRWQQAATFSLPIASTHNAFIYLYQGKARTDNANIPLQQMGVLSSDGQQLSINGESGAGLLVVAAKPLNEPIAAGGPFVMNTDNELQQAFMDYRSGRF